MIKKLIQKIVDVEIQKLNAFLDKIQKDLHLRSQKTEERLQNRQTELFNALQETIKKSIMMCTEEHNDKMADALNRIADILSDRLQP